MFYSDLVKRLLNAYEQIVIYGAKGWIGRSAISILFDPKLDLVKNQILLIGSKSEIFVDSGKFFQIYSASEADKHVSKNCIFLNAAYLRREKLSFYSPAEFIQKNKEISEFGKNQLKQRKIKTFINLSSGVVSKQLEFNNNVEEDLYAKCKTEDEIEIKFTSNLVSATLINCRIYSISGQYINEFEKLALSSFIKQAKTKPNIITVKSPNTYRTYIDSIDLVRMLFELSLTHSNHMIDSGGVLINFGELADKITKIIPTASVNKLNINNQSDNYYGDFSTFNGLAIKLGIKLLDIESQINETIKAFKN